LCSVKEDRVYPLSLFPALLLAGSFIQGLSAASAQDAPPVPDIMPPAAELTPEETPPPPIAAPREPVVVTPPHLLELQTKLRDHPGQRRAEQRVCEAQWGILLGQSNYYPKLNATLSGGRKWVDQTTRADEFGGSNSPEYDGEGLNATLTLRQHLYDWGRNQSIIEGYRQDRFVAELQQAETLNEQLSTLLRMGLQYVLQSRLVAHFDDAKQIIDRDVASMQQRFKAGAARLAEMRQARLVGLEAEARLSQAERQRDLVVQAMKTQFAVTPQQAQQIIDSFISKRPDIPPLIGGLASPQARLIRHNIDKAKAESARLRAERLPNFTGVVTARGWDVGHKHRCNDLVESGHPDAFTTNRFGREVTRGSSRTIYNSDNTVRGYTRSRNCNTYEMTGVIEFSVPLYDGGANAAQRGGTEARRMGLEAELAAHVRSHDAESRRLQDQLLDELTQIAETRQRIDEMETQLASERLLSTRTRGNLLNILSLEQRLADEQARLIGLVLRAEGTRMDALQLTGSLADSLTITLGESGC
jgi:outer membrane protein TolC